MKKNIKSFATFLIGWPLSLVAIYFILKSFSPSVDQLLQIFRNTNLFILTVGICNFLGYYLLRSFIWHKILLNEGQNISYQDTAYLWASSEFKRYIPGNIWSFLGRSVSFASKGVPGKKVTKALFIELQIILIGAFLASLLSIQYLLSLFKISGFLNFQINLLIFLIAVLLVGIYIFQKKVFAISPNKVKNLINYLIPLYTPYEIFKLLIFSFISFIFFGAGYYFSIISIFPISSTLFMLLIGFFVFSLLVGLFSFITPTGLGVREGVITFGLLKILPDKLAGFSSLFARLSLVLSEAIFLIFTCLYSKTSRNFGKKLELNIFNYRFAIVLTFVIIIFNLYFIPVSFLRHDNFYTGRYDLGNMDQTVWNTKNGRIFEFTNPDNTETVSRLAFHADFILILISPFYFLWENPKMLLLIQSVIVSLGAIFVYLLTVFVLESKFRVQNSEFRILGVSLAFSYLMNPSLQWSILYDFHAVTFATTFLIAAFYFMYRRKYFVFIIFCILSGLTKEQVWIPVGLMGLYLAVSGIKYQVLSIKKHKKETIIGILLFIFSISTFYYLVWHAIPNSSDNNEHFALSYFETNAQSPSSLIKNILTDPSETISKLTDNNRLNYIRGILEPTGYIPIFTPWIFIFPSADLFLNIFSDKPELYQIYYQYSAVITPFMYIGMIFSSIFLLKKLKFLTIGIVSSYILLAVIISGYKFGPLPWTKKANIAMFESVQSNKSYISNILQNIPPEYAVSATNNLGAHLTHRINIYNIPQGIIDADYVVFLIRPNSPKYELDSLKLVAQDKNFIKKEEKEGFYLFKKIQTNDHK